MALSFAARRALIVGLKDKTSGDDFADVVDAGSGTLKTETRTRLKFACVDETVGIGIADAVDAGTALSGEETDTLGYVVGSRFVADEIAAALAL